MPKNGGSQDTGSIEAGRRLVIESGVFDEGFYRGAARLDEDTDPVSHYLSVGWETGLNPGPRFDGGFLLPYYQSAGFSGPPGKTFSVLRAANWPVYASRADAEPTATMVRTSKLFDADEYRARLGEEWSELDPALHYVLVGERLGLPPSSQFDPIYYGESRPDVAAAGICFLTHYLQFGRAERRRPRPVAADLCVDAARFASDRETILLVSADARRSPSAILALDIGQRLRKRYNLITLLLRGGDLVDRFSRISALLVCLGDDDCALLEPKYVVEAIGRDRPIRHAIVNGLEAIDVMPAFTGAFVPTVNLIHDSWFYARGRHSVFGYMGEPLLPSQSAAESYSGDTPLQRAIPVSPPGRCARIGLLRQADAEAERRRLTASMRPPDAQDACVVLGAGIVELRKGVDLFLATAWAALTLPDAGSLRFVWIGDGYQPKRDLGYSVYLAEQIERLGLKDRMFVLDAVADLDPAYAMADIFYLPSRFDTLPNEAVEATSRGLPTVCFEGASGIADTLQENPESRVSVVQYLDVRGAARAIVDLANDKERRQRTGDATRVCAQAMFDMDRYINRIDDLASDAAVTIRQRRLDFETLLNDPLFNAGFSLPKEQQGATREKAILRFLAYWSTSRVTPAKRQYLELRRPFPGFHPKIYALHHPEILSGEVNPLAHYIRSGRPPGPWLHKVMDPDRKPATPKITHSVRTAVQAHFHYPDLIDGFLDKLAINEARCDLLLSTNDETKAGILEKATAGFDKGQVEIRIVPNLGRDLGPLLTGYGRDIAGRYDVVGHFHGKRSVHADSQRGDSWREFLWQTLLGGSYPMMDLALASFSADETLGLIFAEEPRLIDWDLNRALAGELAARFGLAIPLPPFFDFPVGNMFWARPDALAPLFGLDLAWSDYPEEPIALDGTLLHAIERLTPFAAGKNGFAFATMHIPGLIW